MRIPHFVLAFVIFAFAVCVITDVGVERRVLADDEIREADEGLYEASAAAVARLDRCDDPESEAVYIYDTFIKALSASLGMLGEPDREEQLKSFVPVLMIVSNRGAIPVVSCGGEVEALPIKYFSDFEEGRAMNEKDATVIREYLEECIATYDRTAARAGEEIHSVIGGSVSSDRVSAITGPCVIAWFSGYPLEGSGKTFSRLAFSGATAVERTVFYVEEGSDGRNYHRDNCPLFTREEAAVVFFDERECVQFGAKACEKCIY